MSGEHLVVLRGNSGSGKTTVAQELQRAMGRGTAAIGQDHFRRTVLREHDVPGGDDIGLIEHTARYCLGDPRQDRRGGPASRVRPGPLPVSAPRGPGASRP